MASATLIAPYRHFFVDFMYMTPIFAVLSVAFRGMLRLYGVDALSLALICLAVLGYHFFASRLTQGAWRKALLLIVWGITLEQIMSLFLFYTGLENEAPFFFWYLHP